MAEKNSFVLQNRMNAIVAKLSDNQAGILFKAVLNYAENGVSASFKDGMVDIAFMMFKQDIDYANAKYQETCEKRAAAGRKGGAPAGNNNANKQNKQMLEKQANALKNKQNKHNDVVVDVDIDIEKEKLKKEKAELTALPPLFAEFWEKYPKKTTKKECLDWWKKNPGKRQAAIAGLSWYIRNTDPGFLLDPIRYLKRERWQDKPEDWQEPRAAAKPQEPQISAEERAEQERWNSLTEEERKAELDAYMAESGGPWKPGG